MVSKKRLLHIAQSNFSIEVIYKADVVLVNYLFRVVSFGQCSSSV